MKRLETLRPGQMPTPKQYNDLVQRVQSLSNITGRNGVTVRPTNNGVSITGAKATGKDISMWARGPSGDQSVSASAIFATVQLKREVYSQGGMVLDSASNQIIVPENGVYNVVGSLHIETFEDFSAATFQQYQMSLSSAPLPSSINLATDFLWKPDSGSQFIMQVNNNVELEAGDGVSMRVGNVVAPGSPVEDYLIDHGLTRTYVTVTKWS